jgi:hypothetical protein
MVQRLFEKMTFFRVDPLELADKHVYVKIEWSDKCVIEMETSKDHKKSTERDKIESKNLSAGVA